MSELSTTDWTLRDEPPASAWQGERLAYGRYKRPFARLDVAHLAPRFRLKEWSYTSCTTPDWFFALAVVQLGYAAQLFCYLVDRRTGTAREMERTAPLGRGLDFAASSLSGTTRWRSRGVAVDSGFDGGTFLKLDLPLGPARLSGELHMEPDESLALLYPLASLRPAYTHKAAGMRTRGQLRWGDRRISLDEGLGALDWTRSIARRHTVWNWACFAGHTESGRRFGLNLSARVYDGERGSLENALWLDGRVRALGGVRFDVPVRTTEGWRVRSLEGDEVDLTFTPWGERTSRLDVGVLRSVFTQPYGLATGTLAGEHITSAFGVMEDHDSLW